MILKPDVEEAKARCNAWWEGEMLDRPPIILTTPSEMKTDYDGPDTDDLGEWWLNPDYVIPRMKHWLQNTAWLGDSIPVVFPVSIGLVAITAQYLGASNRFLDKRTTWSGELIDDWETRGKLEIDESNYFWKQTFVLMERALEMLRESELDACISIPDLNGPSEILAGLRGPANFSLDFYDDPEMIAPALREVQDAWYKAYERTSQKAHEAGGYMTWPMVFSDLPAVDLQSDFSCLISEDHFQEYLLPFIAEQTERIPRTLYHLDGPDAVRHMDAILDLPELNALQWIHGAGQGPMVKWMDLLKRAQAKGKSLWIECNMWEVEPILQELDPKGCLFYVGAPTEEEGCHFMEHFNNSHF